MSVSPSKFCAGSDPAWKAFLTKAKISELQTPTVDPLVDTVNLPRSLPQLIASAYQKNRDIESFQYIIFIPPTYGTPTPNRSIVFTDDDPQRIEYYAPTLFRLFNRLREALNRPNVSKMAIRRAVDDLLELVFETDTNTLPGTRYLVESQVKIVRFDKRTLNHYPTGVAMADGAVAIVIPKPLLQSLDVRKANENHYRSGNYLRQQYAATYVEYKGGLKNNGRQAILDSASIQAVNRVLGVDVTNYSLSIRHNQVDVITSRWEEKLVDDFEYQYRKFNNVFDLSDGLDFLRFYSFLCQLRGNHRSVQEKLFLARDSKRVRADVNPFFEHQSQNDQDDLTSDNGNSETDHMVEDDLELGEEASTKVAVDKFCEAEDSEEDVDKGSEEDDESEEENQDSKRDTRKSTEDKVNTWRQSQSITTYSQSYTWKTNADLHS